MTQFLIKSLNNPNDTNPIGRLVSSETNITVSIIGHCQYKMNRCFSNKTEQVVSSTRFLV
jgi:hypothetical protein